MKTIIKIIIGVTLQLIALELFDLSTTHMNYRFVITMTIFYLGFILKYIYLWMDKRLK